MWSTIEMGRYMASGPHSSSRTTGCVAPAKPTQGEVAPRTKHPSPEKRCSVSGPGRFDLGTVTAQTDIPLCLSTTLQRTPRVSNYSSVLLAFSGFWLTSFGSEPALDLRSFYEESPCVVVGRVQLVSDSRPKSDLLAFEPPATEYTVEVSSYGWLGQSSCVSPEVTRGLVLTVTTYAARVPQRNDDVVVFLAREEDGGWRESVKGCSFYYFGFHPGEAPAIYLGHADHFLKALSPEGPSVDEYLPFVDLLCLWPNLSSPETNDLAKCDHLEQESALPFS